MPAKRRSPGYPPIEGHAVIGNLRTVALVALDGSIDWCCLPELDDPSVFAAILDDTRGGRFRVAPATAETGEQQYLENTNVLETRFETRAGRLLVTDFMPLTSSIIGADDAGTSPTIHRVVRCEAGEVDVEVEWSPRFDYARCATRIERRGDGFVALGGNERMVLAGLPPEGVRLEEEQGASLRAGFRLRHGERITLVCRYGAERARVDEQAVLALLEQTARIWREWVRSGGEEEQERTFGESRLRALIRSALTLKLLTHPDSGAIAAAATTSLPEHIGGVRNWDYRYSWIRDSAFTAQALFELGYRAEAVDFLHWAEDAAMAGQGSAPELRIMYGLHGETDLRERELGHLEGYRCSRPVRIGNGAAGQEQHDIFGELMSSGYELMRRGGRLDPALLRFLSAVADRACDVWRGPDYGIWEVRGGPRHFVYSKVMCWVALDRAIQMHRKGLLRGDVARWRKERHAIRQAVLEQGYDEERGAFVQSFGSDALDASNLLIPTVGFLPFDDRRVRGTIDRTLDELCEQGVVYRYLADDGLPGGEGAFGLTTFWLIDALTLSGRIDQARELFEGMAGRANHVGLYAEEFDPGSGAFLGNFPQGFSHVGFVNSAIYLSRSEDRPSRGPDPIGSKEHEKELGHETQR
jgi:GH15 family glucan-1,4-alpha-glucosidase